MIRDRLKSNRRDERIIAMAGLLGAVFLLLAIGATFDSLLRSFGSSNLVRRSQLLFNAVRSDLANPDPEPLKARFEALAEDERILGMLFCSPGRPPISNSALSPILSCETPLARAAIAAPQSTLSGSLGNTEVAVTSYRIGSRGTLIVVQDRSVLWERRRGVVIATIAATIVALSGLLLLFYYGVRATRYRFSESLRDAFRRTAEGEQIRNVPVDLQPIVKDLDDTVRKIRAEREKADRLGGPEKLRQLVAQRLPNTKLVLVANREPYIHRHSDAGIKVIRPASGLVTGVEPLLKACGGVWVAHGSGSADRESSDAQGRLLVPPDEPEYVLRRIWLTPEEEEGYYYGFANEGLWPLCHIAHTRPTFRASDWIHYQNVNRKFAEAAIEESEAHGVFLIQDYHFGTAPREIRNLMPSAVISLFWHIPWPNDEVVGICPWKRELLIGMLGADVIGFHTRYHCLNFLDTVARYLEARVDLESMLVEYQGRTTRVKPYPISVEWPYPALPVSEGDALRRELGISQDMIVAIGVDRADYTKGLIERVNAVEALFEQHPDLVGRFLLYQIAAPSRTHIKKYRDFVSSFEEAVHRLNRRFGRGLYLPILLQLRHFEPNEVRRAYAMADLAVITPLHDGMNLVAKEYVASCTDRSGALVLSQFAGAAKELEGALLVNPYDANEVADSIYSAISMSDSERSERMQRMRSSLERRTIFDWSAALLRDLADFRERRSIGWHPASGAAKSAST